MRSFYKMQTRNDLVDYLDIPRKSLSYILFVKGVDTCYSTFMIPKRSGGTREISAPTANLKFIQKRLAVKLTEYKLKKQAALGVSTNISHGFQKGKGIITNARVHKNKRYVVNFDLEDFFGSIHFGRIMGYFEKNKDFQVSHEVATAIATLCCYNGKLPQGAPTSPIISNLVCEVLDFRLLKLAKQFKLDYTRYADDLTFSTNDKNFLEQYNVFYSAFQREVTTAGFLINEKKTRLQFRDSKQTVTGLVVNKKLNVDHAYYKQTRAMAHSLYKNGEFLIDGNTGTLNQLESRFAFINMLDKYNNKANSTTNKNKSGKYNGREQQYQKFLFYKYFYANSMPTIVTEGKTDILYIKAALKSLYNEYPLLIEKTSEGNFIYKVRFLRKSQRLQFFLNISPDGGDALTQVYNLYTGTDKNPNLYKYFSNVSTQKPLNPVILIFDNEVNSKNSPLKKASDRIKRSNPDFIDTLSKKYFEIAIPNTNLFVVTLPLVDNKSSCEMEDLFYEPDKSVEIDSKSLSLSNNYDPKTTYGKDTFSKYIFDNYETIDFSRFNPMLTAISNAIELYNTTNT